MLCPKCDHPNKARHTDEGSTSVSRWYICRCRYAFKTISAPSLPDEVTQPVELVVAQTPAYRVRNEPKQNLQTSYPCTECGGAARIKWTERDGDFHVRRRHECKVCSATFYSRTSEADGVTIMRKMPVKLAA